MAVASQVAHRYEMLHTPSVYFTGLFILIFVLLLLRFFLYGPEQRAEIVRLLHKCKKAITKPSPPSAP